MHVIADAEYDVLEQFSFYFTSHYSFITISQAWCNIWNSCLKKHLVKVYLC